MRIHNDAWCNYGFHVALQDTGRQQAELVSMAVKFDRVTSVVSALISHDDVMFFCQQIDDLAFGFVTPL